MIRMASLIIATAAASGCVQSMNDKPDTRSGDAMVVGGDAAASDEPCMEPTALEEEKCEGPPNLLCPQPSSCDPGPGFVVEASWKPWEAIPGEQYVGVLSQTMGTVGPPQADGISVQFPSSDAQLVVKIAGQHIAYPPEGATVELQRCFLEVGEGFLIGEQLLLIDGAPWVYWGDTSVNGPGPCVDRVAVTLVPSACGWRADPVIDWLVFKPQNAVIQVEEQRIELGPGEHRTLGNYRAALSPRTGTSWGAGCGDGGGLLGEVLVVWTPL